MDGQFGILSPVWADTPAARSTSDAAVLRALLEVEATWAHVLASAGLTPSASAEAISAIGRDPVGARISAEQIASSAVGGGNPVIPLLGAVRRSLHDHGASDAALHRSATSQDVLDTALVLISREACAGILRDLRQASRALIRLCENHRDTVCVARSLTQHALPTSFGLRAAGWLDGLTAASTRLARARASLPLQWGGAVGTQAALVELVRTSGSGATGGDAANSAAEQPDAKDSAAVSAAALTDELAAALDLPTMDLPWHTQRQDVLELAGAAAGALAALGKVAGDVLTLQRPEIAELREPSAPGRGGSSAMPQKQNPVLSTLIRSAALAGPGHLGTLHQAAAAAVDERPDGAWHAEWPSLAELLRLTGGAARRAAELLEGLEVRPEAMQRNLRLSGDALLGERVLARLSAVFPGGRDALAETLREAAGGDVELGDLLAQQLPEGSISEDELNELLRAGTYLGRAGEFIDVAVGRAQSLAAEHDASQTSDSPDSPDPATPGASR